MLDWYALFLASVFLLWLASTPRDQNALGIILIASLASELIVDCITHQIQGAWKLVIPGAMETLTILAMLQWSRNRTGYLQAVCLAFAWLAHLLCYLDIALKTDFVYSRYEAIIQLVAVAQILVCYETLARCGRIASSWLNAARVGCGRGLRVASVCNFVLHGKATEIVPEARGTEENSRRSL